MKKNERPRQLREVIVSVNSMLTIPNPGIKKDTHPNLWSEHTSHQVYPETFSELIFFLFDQGYVDIYLITNYFVQLGQITVSIGTLLAFKVLIESTRCPEGQANVVYVRKDSSYIFSKYMFP